MSTEKAGTISKKANINHVAHQIHVTGIGAHKNKKKQIPRKKKNKAIGD